MMGVDVQFSPIADTCLLVGLFVIRLRFFFFCCFFTGFRELRDFLLEVFLGLFESVFELRTLWFPARAAEREIVPCAQCLELLLQQFDLVVENFIIVRPLLCISPLNRHIRQRRTA